MHCNVDVPGDGEIVRRVVNGDVDAFGLLLDRHRALVFGIVMKHVPGNQADEVAHEVFVRAYRSLSTYRYESDFKHWLSQVAVRTCYDYWRREYRSRERPFSALTDDQQRLVERVTSERSGCSYEDDVSRREASEILAWAMNQLSAQDRTVLTLVHLEERQVKEVADLLGWSTANVKIRAYRSRRKLHRILAQLIDSQGEKR